MNWDTFFKIEKEQDYFKELQKKLEFEYKNYTIYPPKDKISEAFKLTPYDKLKVVILGNEPHTHKHMATGLSFSTQKHSDITPTIKNIFKEIENDTGKKPPECGDLTGWAKQGVLLLNNILTVRKDLPNSHKDIGWEIFTNNIIRHISHHNKHVVYMLWGSNRSIKRSIKESRYGRNNYILESTHPNSTHIKNGFFGCKHFTKTNEYLTMVGLKPIDWLKTNNQ